MAMEVLLIGGAPDGTLLNVTSGSTYYGGTPAGLGSGENLAGFNDGVDNGTLSGTAGLLDNVTGDSTGSTNFVGVFKHGSGVDVTPTAPASAIRATVYYGPLIARLYTDSAITGDAAPYDTTQTYSVNDAIYVGSEGVAGGAAALWTNQGVAGQNVLRGKVIKVLASSIVVYFYGAAGQ